MEKNNKVLISGGKGLVGNALTKALLLKGYKVGILSRNPAKNTEIPEFYWNIDTMEIDDNAIEFSQNIIHLAGENIGSQRWTQKRKTQIIESRTKSTQLIAEFLDRHNFVPDTFLSASATGFYGSITSENIFSEADSAYSDFTGKTCKLWEEEVDKCITAKRICKLRTAVVLSEIGGALEKFRLPARFGVFPVPGGGKQYFPWIHLNDLVNLYIFCLENKLEGTYNAVAPEHITLKDFMKIFKGRRYGILIPVPAVFMKILLGEMSNIVLFGSRISSEKIINQGFVFNLPYYKNI